MGGLRRGWARRNGSKRPSRDRGSVEGNLFDVPAVARDLELDHHVDRGVEKFQDVGAGYGKTYGGVTIHSPRSLAESLVR